MEAFGKADLGKETLDFLFDPKAVGTIKGQGDEKARAGVLVPIIGKSRIKGQPVLRVWAKLKEAKCHLI